MCVRCAVISGSGDNRGGGGVCDVVAVRYTVIYRSSGIREDAYMVSVSSLYP